MGATVGRYRSFINADIDLRRLVGWCRQSKPPLIVRSRSEPWRCDAPERSVRDGGGTTVHQNVRNGLIPENHPSLDPTDFLKLQFQSVKIRLIIAVCRKGILNRRGLNGGRGISRPRRRWYFDWQHLDPDSIGMQRMIDGKPTAIIGHRGIMISRTKFFREGIIWLIKSAHGRNTNIRHL